MTNTIQGRCHCGAIHFSLPKSSVGVLACHCEDCRKMHGNFNAFIAAPASEVSLEGADALVWYQSSTTSRRGFYGTCGSRIVKEVTSAGRWLLSAGLIDGDTGKHIVKNLWEKSKPDWYTLPEAAS